MNVFDEHLNILDAINSIETLLSERELQVFGLMTKGTAVKCIAADLGITYKTARVHCTRVLRKLQLNNHSEVAILGWRIRKFFTPVLPQIGNCSGMWKQWRRNPRPRVE